ncbi:MAG TPA: DNA-binding protein WhiA, partial [Eubacteriaceae bacterium]|nr:DNA-binding protein WhiA [Eubacteriaceae bacterium]
MSFSSQTKKDLCEDIRSDPTANRAELSAMIHMGGSLHFGGKNKISFDIKTENASIARYAFKLIKKIYETEVHVNGTKNIRFKNKNTYTVRVSDPQVAMSILLDLQIIVEVDGYKTVNDRVPEFVGEKREYKRAYLKGAFIASGSISDPERTYHMEFVVQDESFGDSLLELLHAFDVPAKMILRKNSYVIYLKDSEHIITTLNIIGAHNALLAIENVKIVKGMRNKVNRVVNCETANLSKTVAASYRQVACIEKIKAKGLY